MLHQRKETAYKPGHAGYVSEFTEFMDRFMEEHPEAVKSQRTGWDIFWDHDIDIRELDRQGRDTVPVKGYEYF